MLERLDNFAAKHKKVKIVRSPVRIGIVQAKMLGAMNAKGPVLVFVHSHIEVMYGWLEPLLGRFVHQNNVLATVFNMRVDRDTLKFDTYNLDKPKDFGGFSWKLDFRAIGLIVANYVCEYFLNQLKFSNQLVRGWKAVIAMGTEALSNCLRVNFCNQQRFLHQDWDARSRLWHLGWRWNWVSEDFILVFVWEFFLDPSDCHSACGCVEEESSLFPAQSQLKLTKLRNLL